MVGVLTGRMIGVMHAMGGGAIEDSGAMVREMQEILDGYTLLLEAYDLLKAEPPRSL